MDCLIFVFDFGFLWAGQNSGLTMLNIWFPYITLL
ncbi:hypothetical protein F383_34848 [Gossypium arboreum]|uniref:Uncharacterized protein n=1 Tax=Gossypium arboreum TaxID=29729 RepID=A0A0B0N502_GOSAR|nr:hypothetical protein F383_34848 [Gossypium arboreum]